jgi:WD40 repeat protein
MALYDYECVHSIECYQSAIKTIVALSDGSIVSASMDHSLELWSSQHNYEYIYSTLYDADVVSMTLLSKHNIIAVLSDRSIAIINPFNKFTCVKLFKDTNDYINCLIVLPNDDIVTKNNFGKIKLWNFE